MSNVLQSPITATTRFCAVYGFPIKHSASPAMHNAALAALNLNWRYLAFPVPPDDLATALLGAARMRFIGLNLTVPHKILALNLMDDLDPTAREWGAVNTVRFEGLNGSKDWVPLAELPPETEGPIRAKGFNTDADAIIRALREDLSWKPEGSHVLLLGAGGAGRVAALRLAAEGVSKLYLVNRTASKAQDIATEIRSRYPATQVEVGYPQTEVDLLINASSLGLRPDDPSPLDPALFSHNRARLVYDMIYRPRETPFLTAARLAGCQTANGLGMLLYQGAKALEIWTGKPAPIRIMREALNSAVYV